MGLGMFTENLVLNRLQVLTGALIHSNVIGTAFSSGEYKKIISLVLQKNIFFSIFIWLALIEGFWPYMPAGLLQVKKETWAVLWNIRQRSITFRQKSARLMSYNRKYEHELMIKSKLLVTWYGCVLQKFPVSASDEWIGGYGENYVKGQ